MTRGAPGRGRLVEVDTLEAFDAQVAAGATTMAGWRVQDLDLTDRSAMLRRLDPAGALFLGCALTPADERSLRDRGALLFPDVPVVPFNAYRTALYTPGELYDGLGDGYEQTLDARVYAWSRRYLEGAAEATGNLARALHDHAVDEALGELVAGRRLVGIMGGHAHPRGNPAYVAAARLGSRLARAGLVVTTGGGPGAMEAANLGAAAAGLDDADLDGVVAQLADVPDFRPSVTAWAARGLAVLDGLPDRTLSLGIPTWFYGHEPPNVFASHIAKYFRNALREDTLLQVCRDGIVFLPGAAGTVQEIFQDACENYYADEGSRALMVLVGRDHWTEHLPTWPLLRRLAEEAGFADRVSLVDSVDEVPALLA